MQQVFDALPGVISTVVGYMGGSEVSAHYSIVSTGFTTHQEVIEITYDPTKISYSKLIQVFFCHIDPEQADGQFYDKGPQYRTCIYYSNAKEKKIIETIKEQIIKSGVVKTVATDMQPVSTFYPAENYHQQYYIHSEADYKRYTCASDRYKKLEAIWGKDPAKYFRHTEPGE